MGKDVEEMKRRVEAIDREEKARKQAVPRETEKSTDFEKVKQKARQAMGFSR